MGGEQMGQFGCIYFNEANILLSKVRFEPIHYAGANGYEVFVPRTFDAMREKDWINLEYRLEDHDIEYVIMDSEENPFENIHLIDGKTMKHYLSYCLLQYIYRYKLIKVDKLYTNVGIIAGRVDATLEVAGAILNDVTDLTFFLNQPVIYKGVINEIYETTRLKAKAKVPCSASLRKMDIIFDLVGNYHYAKWCKPTAIYINLSEHMLKDKINFSGAPPSMWHDFDIICESRPCDIKMLEAAFYAQGIFKNSFINTFKSKHVKVDTIYNTCIS